MSDTFELAMANCRSLNNGENRRLRIQNKTLMVARVEDEFYLIDDLCSHEDSSLSLGCMRGHLVDCTLHGSRFDVRTGEPTEEPATEPVKTYRCEIRGDDLWVRLD